MPAEKVVLFDVPIDNLTMGETVARIEEMIHSGKPHQHVVVNVDKIVKLQRDQVLREAILGCDLINADGQPIVWASRILQNPLKERVTGIDLFSNLTRICHQKGYRIFLLGARQEVVAKVAAMVNPAGWRNGYWQPDEEAAVVAAIKAAKPDVLFVAMSSPKKELFLRKWKAELQIPFVMGVGGTFDVVAGVVKRAPRWMQQCGLEWLYRLGQEPGRMWRRYLVEDMAFFGLLAREWWRRR
ncbi:MAG: UDP-N-acetyl-D-mannosaminuronic acid transferase [Verrucomicrobiae bacterium]|nr:UDP-N-acetyl-D-mannosaminuronic acid transferase [Verrucomicrobiae bacterium]